MKFNVTAKELWFWRIAIFVLFFLAITNRIDNRQQDKLIFSTIDEMETTTTQITQISGLIKTNQEAIIMILKELNK
jgi:hypothetical protein